MNQTGNSYVPFLSTSNTPKIIKKYYYKFNIIAALIHLANSITFLVIYYLNNKKDILYKITTSYPSWHIEDNNKFYISTSISNISSISLHWLIFSFHIISFLFQTLVYVPIYNYKDRVEKYNNNPLRFIEYSISAPLMLIAIGLLSGITDFCTIVFMFITTSLCMLCGSICEFKKSLRIFHFIGWVCILLAYFPILFYFFFANYKANQENNKMAPSFVYIIVISQFILFQSFGIVQLLQLYPQNISMLNIIGSNSEMSYITLSLISKSLLGWMIYSNVFLLGN